MRFEALTSWLVCFLSKRLVDCKIFFKKALSRPAISLVLHTAWAVLHLSTLWCSRYGRTHFSQINWNSSKWVRHELRMTQESIGCEKSYVRTCFVFLSTHSLRWLRVPELSRLSSCKMMNLQNPLFSTLLYNFWGMFWFVSALIGQFRIELNRAELVHGFFHLSKVVLPLMEAKIIESIMLKMLQISYLTH